MASAVPLPDLSVIEQEIDWLLRQRPRSRPVSRAVEQLTSALQELRTTREELEIQNEEILKVIGELDCQRERYRRVFDLLPDACLFTDADGFVSDANSRVADLLGRARPQLVDAFVADAFTGEAATEVRSLTRRGEGAVTIEHGGRVLEVRAQRLEEPVDRMVTRWVIRDTSAEFEGEDLNTESVAVARSWLKVYGELVTLTEQAVDTSPKDRREPLDGRLARLEMRRRAWRDRHAELSGLLVDRERRTLTVGLKEVPLTRRETQLLTFLLQHPGVSFSAEALLNRAWLASFLSPEQLRTYVGRLRRKLEEVGAACRLENVRGTGYRLVFD